MLIHNMAEPELWFDFTPNIYIKLSKHTLSKFEISQCTCPKRSLHCRNIDYAKFKWGYYMMNRVYQME